VRKKKFPPNPLPCGCSAVGIQDLEDAVDDGSALVVGYKNVHVVHCQLHAAAPELLEALRDMTAFVGWMSFIPQETVAECDRLTEKALDAIQKAEGQS
jgi:hypothetical protein